ncbi:MAG: aspartate dehydrogenase [Pseudorhodoplanes sp.]
MSRNLRVVFVGYGAINSRVGDLLKKRGAPVEIVGVATRDDPVERARIPQGVAFLGVPSELAALKPDLIVEAAGRAAIDAWAPAALASSPLMIIASTSAFTDDALLPRLLAIAEQNGSRIILPSGAIGGIDAIASAATLGLDRVVHQIVKPPIAWKGTQAESLLDLDALKERRLFFTGTAREAASRYPQNANATVVTSLAGIGLDRTEVELVADPGAKRNGHIITAEGGFGRMTVHLENNALATNPKSSELTALSLVRLIEQQSRPLTI